MPTAQEIGGAVAMFRKAAGMKQITLAHHAHVTERTVVNKLMCVIDVEACMQAVVALPRGGRFSDDDVRLAIATFARTHSAHDVASYALGLAVAKQE